MRRSALNRIVGLFLFMQVCSMNLLLYVVTVLI